MQLRLSSVFVASVVFASLGCAAETAPSSEEPESVVGETSQGLKKEALDVSFQNCSEVASITTLSVAKARTVVPSSFMLAGDASGAPFVVRIANCNAVRIDGGAPEAGTVAQLGISVVSPDGTGDINNYTAYYYTTSARLARELKKRGVPAEHVPNLTYAIATSGASKTLSINVPVDCHESFRVTAPIVEPGTFAIPFTANWWVQNGNMRTKMSTPIPSIRFGSATATLDASRFPELRSLLGRSTTTFTLLDSFNRFASAPMTVTVS
jgi:hypothetical protein